MADRDLQLGTADVISSQSISDRHLLRMPVDAPLEQPRDVHGASSVQRRPVATSCTYTTGLRDSKET